MIRDPDTGELVLTFPFEPRPLGHYGCGHESAFGDRFERCCPSCRRKLQGKPPEYVQPWLPAED